LPIQGRLVDRVGQTKVLVPIALFNPLSLIALVAAADAGAPPAVLAIIGAASGASIPALSPCMRTLWATLVDDARLRQSALALGAAIGAMEISTTALATSFGTPAFAGVLISVQGGASMFGGLWYGSRDHAKPAAERYPRLCLLIALGFAPLLLTSTQADSIV